MSVVWKYFDKIPGDQHLAKCRFCSSELSYRTTVSNLKKHLNRRHREGIIERARTKSESDLDNTISAGNCIKVKDQDEESNSSIKSTDIYERFEREGSAARCTLCQDSTGNNMEDMKNHLEEQHAGIMISILKPEQDTRASTDDESRKEYTEILYVEQPRPTQKRSRAPRRIDPIEQEDDAQEIDSFANYVGILMKKVPKRSLSQVQLDVISLILKSR